MVHVLPNNNEEYDKKGEATEALFTQNDREGSEKKLPVYQSFTLESEDEEKTNLFLYFSSFTADLLIFSAGIAMSYTSPVIPKLQSEKSPLNAPITTFQISLFVSLLGLGKLIGPFIYGKLADRIGRRWTLYAISVPMAWANMILAFASDVRLYYIARILLGAGAGAAFAVVSTYNGEIAQHKNRGIVGALGALFASLGTLFPYSVGPYLSVKWFSLSCLAPLIGFYILAPIFLVESPLYATRKNDFKTAKKSLKKLRTKCANIENEFAELHDFVSQTKEQDCGYIELFTSKNLRKPLFIGMTLAILQQLTGIGAVISYLHTIFNSTGSKIPSQWASLAVGITKMAIVFVCSALIDRKGRRFLLITSGLGMGSSSITLAIYVFLYSRQYTIAQFLWWVPLVALILFVLFFNFGLGPVLFTLMGEIFPANIRATASSMITTILFSTSAIVGFIFPFIQEYCGIETAFFIFSIFGFLCAAFTYFFLPETKGLTMSEIQDMWSEKKMDLWNIKRRMSEAIY